MSEKVITLGNLKYYNDVIQSQLNNRVTIEDGKGLSSNDFTDELKEKINLFNPDIYATEEFVSNEISKIDIPEPDLTGYVSKKELAELNFYDIQNNPILNTEDGKLLFTDENGNIGLQLEADNTLYVKDVVAGENILSNKADISYVDDKLSSVEIPSLDEYAKVSDIPSLDGYAKTSDIPSLDGYAKTSDIPSISGLASEKYVDDKFESIEIPTVDFTGLATEQWVEDKKYLTRHQDITHLATKEELANKDFYEIHNNPILNTEDGKLLFVDESGNIGLQLEADNTLYVKDIYCSDVSFSYLLNYISQLENRILQLEQTLNK